MVGRLRVEHIHLATCYRLSFMYLHEEMSMSVLKFNQLLLQKPTSRWNALVPFHGRGCWKIQEKKKTNERGMEESSSLFTLWYVGISIQYCKLPAGNFHLHSRKHHTTIKVSSGFLQVHDSVFKFHEFVCLSTSAWARSLTSSQVHALLPLKIMLFEEGSLYVNVKAELDHTADGLKFFDLMNLLWQHPLKF